MNSIDAGEKRELRNFGLLLGGFVYGIFGILWPMISNGFSALVQSPELIPRWPWLLGALIQIWALTHPGSLTTLQKRWLMFAKSVAWINERIIMLFLFYLIILPIALILRIVGRDSLQRKIEKKAGSYRAEVKPRPPNHMKNPY